jgi:hypothetical protein
LIFDALTCGNARDSGECMIDFEKGIGDFEKELGI